MEKEVGKLSGLIKNAPTVEGVGKWSALIVAAQVRFQDKDRDRGVSPWPQLTEEEVGR